LRDALTRAAARRVTEITALGNEYTAVGEVVDERAVVNGIVGLHATGGSTNHTIHLVAMARAAGIQLTWDDFADLSEVVPLLCRIYPNGLADVNHFHAAGGMALLVGELLDAGLLHEDVRTVAGEGGLARYREEPVLAGDGVAWREGPRQSLDAAIVRPRAEPFSPNGGLKLLEGNLGRAVIKVSAVKPERWLIEAPALIFHEQAEVEAAFRRGELERDLIAVVRFQGPRANGMPELHKLTPLLGVLQDKGFKVALVTDGRMSGASGKVPAAIHVTPEAAERGPLARLRHGDLVRLDARSGRLDALVDEAEWSWRSAVEPDLSGNAQGVGRELFANFRSQVSSAELGAAALGFLPEPQALTRAEADARF
jgi:phosphogluconate dehydratase